MISPKEYFLLLCTEIPDTYITSMFGFMALKRTNGELVSVLKKNTLVVKVQPKKYKKLLALTNPSMFCPKKNRPMKGWFQISFEDFSVWKKYIENSYRLSEPF